MYKHKKSARSLAGKALVAALLIFGYFQNYFGYLELKLEDKVYQRPGLIDPRIVVVGIDEYTLTKFGPLSQWSRSKTAEAINILNSGKNGKPAVIGIDLLFAGAGDAATDQQLAQAAKNAGNVVLASQAYFEYDMHGNKSIQLLETPYPALARATRQGLSNGTIDQTDSVVRSALLQYPYGGGMVHSFGYEIYSEYTGEPSIPELDGKTQLYISYSGYPKDYSWAISFADLFEEDFNPDIFTGSIVLIGPYASAMMDYYYTPISSKTQMFGVEVHANVVKMLLDKNFKSPVSSQTNFYVFLLMLCIGLLLMGFLEVRALLAAYLALAAGFIFLALHLFDRGYIFQLLYPIVTLAVLYLYHMVSSYLSERLEKQRVQNTLMKYVDPRIAQFLVEMGETQRNEVGSEKDLAVLFVDIRGFTPLSETLKQEPGQIVHILNEFLEHTSNCVFQNGGSIDKFIGDATMALFNGFAPLEDYTFKAVKAALDIVKGTEELNARLLSKYQVEVGFGVGIQSGRAIVGNLGPTFRKDYTAIGDTVNTAARLESIAGKSQILITQEIYDQLQGRIQAEYLDDILLKGKSAPISIYAVSGLVEEETT